MIPVKAVIWEAIGCANALIRIFKRVLFMTTLPVKSLFKELGQVSGWIFIMGPKAAKHYKQVK
jgi:hypothetical protein